jgi:hypothetical protein
VADTGQQPPPPPAWTDATRALRRAQYWHPGDPGLDGRDVALVREAVLWLRSVPTGIVAPVRTAACACEPANSARRGSQRPSLQLPRPMQTLQPVADAVRAVRAVAQAPVAPSLAPFTAAVAEELATWDRWLGTVEATYTRTGACSVCTGPSRAD